MSKLVKGTSYAINNKWYEVVWSGSKYAYCSSYNDKTNSFKKELMKISDLVKGLYCPF